MRNHGIAWIALATALILLIPLVAMQYTSDVNWTAGDFAVAGVLLFGTGSAFVLATRILPQHRALVAAVLAAGFVYLWAELAVGVFTEWGS